LTQENLAKMVGLNRSTASRIINDYRRRKILGGQRGMLVIYRSRTRTALKKAGLTLG
jgi:CRP-like cAMP-binding protein